VRELADRIAAQHPDTLEGMPEAERVSLFGLEACKILHEEQKADLAEFRVHMDIFRHETDLYAEDEVSGTLKRLEDAGLTYANEGAVWLRTTRFGDEKDRVLVKSDGTFTYFLPDVAYHVDKHRRGFERAIDVWGADHHGHVPRMQAAMQALGLGPDYLETLIMQLVTVMRGGVEVRMSKRAGEFVTLRELFEETGVDVARYFFLMRRAEAAMNFDLDLALDTSESNPVYKVQYAHARMCSVFARGGIEPASIETRLDGFAGLTSQWELDAARQVLRFPFVVRGAAAARAPYMLCAYLEETAGAVNAWYHQGNVAPEYRVLAEGPSRDARIGLARAVQITLRNGLNLLGVSAPERMQREENSE
jgi:arginyl-tRNA synthetase